MAEKLEVTIRTNPPGSSTCIAEHFIAGRGKTVTIMVPEFPTADLIFPDGGSPFTKDPGEHKIQPGKHKVRDDVPLAQQPNGSVQFSYKIEWKNPPGKGNGTGEVPPPG